MSTHFPVQHEIKTGFVFLHSCDGCSSHLPVIQLAQSIIQRVNDLLEVHQPGPNLPPSPSDYVGNYTIGGAVSEQRLNKCAIYIKLKHACNDLTD